MTTVETCRRGGTRRRTFELASGGDDEEENRNGTEEDAYSGDIVVTVLFRHTPASDVFTRLFAMVTNTLSSCIQTDTEAYQDLCSDSHGR
jgi:hypothetical protein